MSIIGPNAVLQMVGPLQQVLGVSSTERILKQAGLQSLPDGESMIDEHIAARLHQHVRRVVPAEQADLIMRSAGEATGEYILANRIPAPARWLLRHLPAALSARLLTAAIARHAWTFAGSGAFRVISHQPLMLGISRNPVVAGEQADRPLCLWHAAVFERLYNTLAGGHWIASETRCCGAGWSECRFVLLRRREGLETGEQRVAGIGRVAHGNKSIR